MSCVRKFPALFFTAVCLFPVRYSTNPVIDVKSDDDFTAKINAADQNELLNIFCFVDETEYYDVAYVFISKLVLSYPETTQVFKVDLSTCQTTGKDFGLDINDKITIILRKFGRHKVTLIYPEWQDLKNEVDKYKYMQRDKDQKMVQEITDYGELGPALAAADRSDKLVFVFTVKRNDCEGNIETEIEVWTKKYETEVVVFKIDSAINSEVKKQFSQRAEFLRDRFPKMLYRRNGKDIHWLIGYEWDVFHNLLNVYAHIMHANDFTSDSFKVTIIGDVKESFINAVQYAEDDKGFKKLLAEAESEKIVIIILYFVQNDDDQSDDSSVDQLAKQNPLIRIIRINTENCKEASEEYADKTKKKAKIDEFPTFIVRPLITNRGYRNEGTVVYFQKKLESLIWKYTPALEKVKQRLNPIASILKKCMGPPT